MAADLGVLEVAAAPILLECMPQQEKIESPDDDWTGKCNQAERRRRQNRLNQRSYRKRKEQQLLGDVSSGSPFYIQSDNTRTDLSHSSLVWPSKNHDIGVWPSFNSAISSPEPQIWQLTQVAIAQQFGSRNPDATVKQFQRWVAQAHHPDPLADHVLVLIKFNIFRALVHNAITLGFEISSTLEDNALSPFTPKSSFSNPTTLSNLPTSLRPTFLQCHIPHHPWIDLLPVPRMRDNLILAGDDYDDFELCEDLCGLFNSSKRKSEARTGLIIWGEPWDPDGWEITSSFLERWGWILEGCDDLMLSTNRWREKRYERPLRFGSLDVKNDKAW